MSDPVYTCEALAAIPIHASAVQTNGGALLFLGPSETGKSTVRQLLEVHLPPLADDVVYLLSQAAGGWGVAAADARAFFAGPLPSAEAARLSIVPLQAVIRLYRATKPRLERIAALETCCHLTDAFFEVYWPRYSDVETKKMAFGRLACVAAEVAGYHLYFDRSAQTVRVLAEEFPFYHGRPK